MNKVLTPTNTSGLCNPCQIFKAHKLSITRVHSYSLHPFDSPYILTGAFFCKEWNIFSCLLMIAHNLCGFMFFIVRIMFPLFYYILNHLLKGNFKLRLKWFKVMVVLNLKKLKSYLFDNGILRRLSCPYTPSENGVIERHNKHVFEVGLAVIMRSSFPMTYWTMVSKLLCVWFIDFHLRLFEALVSLSYSLKQNQITLISRCLVAYHFLRQYNHNKL